jgi:hypothetical protein
VAFQKDVYKTGIKESRNGRREKRKRLLQSSELPATASDAACG